VLLFTLAPLGVLSPSSLSPSLLRMRSALLLALLMAAAASNSAAGHQRGDTWAVIVSTSRFWSAPERQREREP
jgi:hypothetical protein